LTADTLQPIKKVDLAAHALEPEPPRIGSLPPQLSPLLLAIFS